MIPKTQPPELPTRETLTRWTPELLQQARSSAQSDVYLLRSGEVELVLKDSLHRSWPFRYFVARVLRREARIMQRLADVSGVPRVYGWLDRRGLIMQRLRAERVSKRNAKRLTAEFFDRLDELVGRMHALGVAHGDIRRKNILLGEAGEPYLIDFATAVERDRWLGNWLFNRVVHIDQLKLLDLRNEYFPETLTGEQRSLLQRGAPLSLRLGRLYKRYIYRRLKQKRWRRRSKKVFTEPPERR